MYFYCYVHVFLLLYMFYSVYSVSLCCSVYSFMCKSVTYCCHRVYTQLQLTNISYDIKNGEIYEATIYPGRVATNGET